MERFVYPGGKRYSYAPTSKIEGVWSVLKIYINSMYVSTHYKSFIYFLKEADYKKTIK